MPYGPTRRGYVELLPRSAAAEEATSILAHEPETEVRIDRVLRLVEGFESAYGLELLATVHWAAQHERPVSDDEILRAVMEWSPRKRAMFNAPHVQTAIARLRDEGWIEELVPA